MFALRAWGADARSRPKRDSRIRPPLSPQERLYFLSLAPLFILMGTLFVLPAILGSRPAGKPDPPA